MTAEEFGLEFDIIYNNITSDSAPPLNNYEKSVFLTKAQEEIVWSYIRPQTNRQYLGLDGDVLRRAELGFLLCSEKPTFTKGTGDNADNTYTYSLGEDFMMVLSETITVNSKTYTVIPLSAAELNRIGSRQYQKPPKHQIWKTDEVKEVSNGSVSVTGTYVFPYSYQAGSNITGKIIYIRYPQPIIVGTGDDKSPKINGVETKDNIESEFPAFMHRIIVQKAAELAKQIYVGTIPQNNI